MTITTNNIGKKENDVKLEDYEVQDNTTSEEIEELKEVKKINNEIDDLKLNIKDYLSDDSIKKILKNYPDDLDNQEKNSKHFKGNIMIDVGNLTPEEIEKRIELEKNRNPNIPINSIGLVELSDRITDNELETFEISKTIDNLKIKISDLTQEKELIILKYQQDIYSPEKKKDYPNETSRVTALNEELSKDTKYNLIEKEIKTIEKTITDLGYLKDKNNILKSNFKRLYDIKMRPVYALDNNSCSKGTLTENQLKSLINNIDETIKKYEKYTK